MKGFCTLYVCHSDDHIMSAVSKSTAKFSFSTFDIQFCMNTSDQVISLFSMRMNTISSLRYIWVIVLLSHRQYRLYRRKTHKKRANFYKHEIHCGSTHCGIIRVCSIFHSSGVSVLNLSLM